MPYLILAHDHPGMDARREAVRDAHRAHLAAQGRKLLASGALLARDGTTVIGGASLYDTDDYQEAARFEAEDPYARAGIRARVEIVQWRLSGGSESSTPPGTGHSTLKSRPARALVVTEMLTARVNAPLTASDGNPLRNRN